MCHSLTRVTPYGWCPGPQGRFEAAVGRTFDALVTRNSRYGDGTPVPSYRERRNGRRA